MKHKTFTVHSDPKSQYTLVDVLTKKNNTRGVFAKYFIEKGVLISCDVELSENNSLKLIPWQKNIAGTNLSHVFCVGFAFYMQRSTTPNVKIYELDYINMKIIFEIVKSIIPGEELFLEE